MSDLLEAKVPDIGNFTAVPVIEILVQPGDRVEKDQGLVTLESDKATMEVPAPAAGIIKALKVKLDDTVSEGTIIGLLEVDGTEEAPSGDETAPTPKAEQDVPPADESEVPPATPSAPAQVGPREPPLRFEAAAVLPQQVPFASPALRKFARQLGVDLTLLSGSGRNGRIQREDIQAFVKRALTGGGVAAARTGVGSNLDLLPWPQVDFAKFGPIEQQALTRIQRITGANLARNWAMIPHVTQHDEADITEMEAFRKQLGQENKAIKVTPLVFLIKAVVATLKEFPRFNASLDSSGETLTLKKYFHIGIAVDTPDGLVVPVLRDCDQKGLLELAVELAAVSAKARDKKLGPADMSGGCFSISSLGGIGGTAFTPIINAPEVAILGVSRSKMQPLWNGESFTPRLLLPLSLSYDHRVIDGAAAAHFTRHLSRTLTDLRRILL